DVAAVAPTGTKPEPGRFFAVMSASCALIDMATAGVCSGMYFTTHVGRSSAKAPWIMPTSRLLTVTGAPESPGCPHTWLTIVPGSWPGPQTTPHEDPVVRPSLHATSPVTGSGPRPSIWKPSTLFNGRTLAGSNWITA